MNDATPSENMQKKTPDMKKTLSYASLAFSLISIFIVFIIGVIAWLALDDFEKKIISATEHACGGLTGAINALGNANDAFGDIKNSLNNTADSFLALGNSMIKGSAVFSVLDKSTAANVKEAGEKINEASRAFSSADEKIGNAQEGINSIRSSLLGERNVFCDNSFKEEIGKVRIVLLLGVLAALMALGAFCLNSIVNIL